MSATALPRRVIMTSLMTGFTLAIDRVHATTITTPATGLIAGEVQIPTDNGDLPAYRAKPQGKGPFPVVLVFEEVFGVHEYIKDICRRLAHLGYYAIATEYYARLGDLAKATDFKQIMPIIGAEPDAQMMADTDSTADFAGQDGGDLTRFAATGFCRGGRHTWLYAAHSRKILAAVAWYGPLGGEHSKLQPQTAIDLAGEINCPLLALYGGKDKGITDDQRAQVMKAVEANNRTVLMKIYPDAEHGFHADYRPSYNEAAAKDGWARMLAFFKANGVS